jgi:hypothetical protein
VRGQDDSTQDAAIGFPAIIASVDANILEEYFPARY